MQPTPNSFATITSRYTPRYKADQLLYGGGNAIIVAGWIPLSVVERKLQSKGKCLDSILAMGSLFSKGKGLEYLFQNLICDGYSRHLIILNDSRAIGSGEVRQETANSILAEFFRSQGSCIPPLERLSQLIGEAPIESLAQNTMWHFCHIDKLSAVIDAVDARAAGQPPIPWLPTEQRLKFQEIFDKAEASLQKVSSLPSDIRGHQIVADSEYGAWLQAISRVTQFGVQKSSGYGGSFQEISGLKITVKSPYCDPGLQDLRLPPEWELPVGTPFTLKSIKEYIPNVVPCVTANGKAKTVQKSVSTSYTYGDRIFSMWGNQVEGVIAKLRKEWHSNSAVISLWDNEKGNDSPGSPCLNHIWFSICEGGRLYAHFTFRSHDIFNAWVPNVIACRRLQISVAEGVGVALGHITTYSLSAHIYDIDLGVAKSLTENLPASKNSFSDPVGNFYVEKQSGNRLYKVSLFDPQTQTTVWWDTGSRTTLLKKIEQQFPTIQLSNFLWIADQMPKR